MNIEEEEFTTTNIQGQILRYESLRRNLASTLEKSKVAKVNKEKKSKPDEKKKKVKKQCTFSYEEGTWILQELKR